MRISICGDVCPAKTNEFWIKNDIKKLFHNVPLAFEGSDRIIVNLECALTERETAIKKFGPNLKASPLCAKLLKEIGVTDCALSNNHIFDYGVGGVQDTIATLEAEGICYTGFGNDYEQSRENLIIEKDGISVAIINVCEHEYSYALKNRMGARGFDPFDTIEDVQKAKAQNDYVVVLYHGGKEQSIYPSPRLRKLCQALVKQGADLVLCQHSHCIGCYEKFQKGHILYGQGNFHFVGMSTHPHWLSGFIVQLDIDKDFKISFLPIKVVGDGIQLAVEEAAESIMNAFKLQSENLKSDKWLKEWEMFCKENGESYISCIRNAYTENATPSTQEKFLHYLKCEAHQDVWNELCKFSWETRLEP